MIFSVLFNYCFLFVRFSARWIAHTRARTNANTPVERATLRERKTIPMTAGPKDWPIKSVKLKIPIAFGTPYSSHSY